MTGRLPPLVLRAARPVGWTPESTFAVPASFSEMAARGRARDAVKARWLRPADLDRATVGQPERLWLPLWRVEGAVDGFHVGLRPSGAPGRGRVLPTGGFRHEDAVVLVPARQGFAIDVSERAVIARGDMRPQLEVAPPDDEIVEADVSREAAEDEARLRLRRRGEPRQALYASVDVTIRAVDPVLYPVWVVRYLYAGEASEGTESQHHAAVSAHTGATVGERHPPLFGSIKSRLRALF